MLNTVIFYSAREDFRSEELDFILKTMRLNMVMQNSADRQEPLKKWTEHSQELHHLKIHSRGAPITLELVL